MDKIAFGAIILVAVFCIKSLRDFPNYLTLTKSSSNDSKSPLILLHQKKVLFLTELSKAPKQYSILIMAHESKGTYFTEPTAFNSCHYKNCFATKDKNYFGENNEDQFDAVIVERCEHETPESAANLLKLKRSPNQIYIMRTMEAAEHQGKILIKQDYLPPHYFNFTWSVYEDSNITFAYGPVYRHKDENFTDPTYNLKGKPASLFDMKKESKTKKVLWVVSHCVTAIKREDYALELKKFIDVDIFGHCHDKDIEGIKPLLCSSIGNCTEEMERVCTEAHDNNCVKEVSKRYKFYLAFESSRCDNYWTEKLSRTLNTPVIPIVMGAADYSQIIPKEAYINVDDFESPQKLAEYLHYLDDNWDEYMKYFEWRKDYVRYFKLHQCELCQILNQPWKPHHSIENITRWFFFKNDNTPRCHDPGSTYYL